MCLTTVASRCCRRQLHQATRAAGLHPSGVQGPARVSTFRPPGLSTPPAATASDAVEGSHAAAALSSNGSSSSSEVPWQFGFQCNERYLQWDGSAQRQLVKLYACQKLGLSMDRLELQLEELAAVLPDMAGKLERIKGDVLVSFLQDLPGLAWRLLGLKEILPSANVSLLVSRHPDLVLKYSKEEISQKLQQLRNQLPGVNVVALLEVEPMLLFADIGAVLEDLKRLAPDADPVRMLVNDPLAVLDMAQAGQHSSIEMNGELMP